MNFLALDYFLVVAEELNITKAAERLYISQQSLSNQIIKLEKELDIQLFVRSPQFALTYAGTRLVRAATQMMDVKRQILSEIDDINNNRRGELKLGVSHTRGRALLPEILPFFNQTHPLVEITLVEDNSETLEHHLQHGMIDLMIGFMPVMLEGVETLPLITDRLFLVVPRKFMQMVFGNKTDFMRGKFSESADITPFKECPFLFLKKGNRIRSLTDLYLKSKNISPQVVLETENIETAFALSVKGMGITVYPEMFLNNLHKNFGEETGVDFFPLNNSATVCRLCIAYSRNRYLSKAAQDFIEIAQRVFEKKQITPIM